MGHELYKLLAALLTYPGNGYAGQIDDVVAASRGRQSGIGDELAAFAELVRPVHVHDLQELFIGTFDLSPVCSLEVGWHLFGENYDRGLLLVKMRQQLRIYGVEETTELPDHLTNAFQLLARMEPDAGAHFSEAIVLPALEKMLAAIRGKNNPYYHVLRAAQLAVREDFPGMPEQLGNRTGEPELRVLA